MRENFNELRKFTLSNTDIDEASKFTQAYLSAHGVPAKEATRCRLSVEEVMHAWHGGLGSEKRCSIGFRKRLSCISIELTAEGERVDPYLVEEENEDFSGERNLLARLGLTGSYAYTNGVNEVTLSTSKEARNPIISVALAVVLAILIGLVLKLLPATTCTTISANVISPLFSTLLNLLSSIATPMIFFAVCSGIYSIGDMALLGAWGRNSCRALCS